jgi:hypothetical protein
MPSPVRVRPIRAGDEISVAVEGGFVRRKAPVDGIAIETPERDIFLPVDSVLEALRQLDAAPAPTASVPAPVASKKAR